MAEASWAHISAYCASVAAIAAVFWPKKFVAISAISNARLAAITGGGTVIAYACSKAIAAAMACIAVCWVCSAVIDSQLTYGMAVAVIACAAGPYQLNVVKSESTDR